jgi:hypothetical protein
LEFDLHSDPLTAAHTFCRLRKVNQKNKMMNINKSAKKNGMTIPFKRNARNNVKASLNVKANIDTNINVKSDY